jgi:dephospho-CoA kinase
MLKVGLTGGIGSGKSLICSIFSILKVPVYNADNQAKRIMAEDMQLRARLVKEFGPGVIRDGETNRKALAEIVFNDPDALRTINSIVHPAVLQDFMSWVKMHSDSPYIVKEAAILMESAMHKYLDLVILVTAPEELRIERIKQRDGEAESKIRQRMSNQWPDEKKIPMAGMVIRNDNTSPVLPLILELHSELSRGHLPDSIIKNN